MFLFSEVSARNEANDSEMPEGQAAAARDDRSGEQTNGTAGEQLEGASEVTGPNEQFLFVLSNYCEK